MNRYNVEEIYQGFWKKIVCDEDGNINVEQVKNELCDFYHMLQEVPKVYSEITNGVLSKPMYDATTVLNYFDEQYKEKALSVDLLQDDWDLITADCVTKDDYKKAVFGYFDIE